MELKEIKENAEVASWSEDDVKDFFKKKGLSDKDIVTAFVWIEGQHDVWYQDGWEDGYDEGYSDGECE